MTAKYIVTVNVVVIDKESQLYEDFDYGSFAAYETTSSVVAGRVARYLEGNLVRLPAVDEDAVIEEELQEII